jgi:tetratricopeptide (TPR) repeat protein
MAPIDHSGSTPKRRLTEAETRSLPDQGQVDFELEFFGRLLERDPVHVEAIRVHANNLAARGHYARALVLDRRLVRLRPERAIPWYNLACTLSRLGLKEPAIGALERALELGYRHRKRLAVDPDLDSLRDDHRFQKLLRRFLASTGP